MVALVFVDAAELVVVGQLPVVNHRYIGEWIGPEGMGVVYVNPALGSHAHVADAVSASDGADVVALVHGRRGANVLDDLGTVADAVQGDAGGVQQGGGQFRTFRPRS